MLRNAKMHKWFFPIPTKCTYVQNKKHKTFISKVSYYTSKNQIIRFSFARLNSYFAKRSLLWKLKWNFAWKCSFLIALVSIAVRVKVHDFWNATSRVGLSRTGTSWPTRELVPTHELVRTGPSWVGTRSDPFDELVGHWSWLKRYIQITKLAYEMQKQGRRNSHSKRNTSTVHYFSWSFLLDILVTSILFTFPTF